MILRDPSLRPGGGVIRSGHSRSHIYDPRKILTAGLPADEEENKLKQKLQAKLKNRKGFTLIEMLIVVAIIAILVAVSIPLVSGSLEKARIATDQANERAAKAAAMIDYLTEGETGTMYYAYDAEAGTVTGGDSADDATAPASGYGQCSKHEDGYVLVTITANAGEVSGVKVEWKATGDGTVTAEAHGTSSEPITGT